MYETVGKEFFTYFVLFVVISGTVALLYLFISVLKIRSISQYLWLFLCAGLFIYLTNKLREHPEEAVHILEYGLLSFFVFKALNGKIHDWTIFLSAGFGVLFVGTLDEFFQWLIPTRYWGFHDVALNGAAGGIFLLAIWKGIRPKTLGRPVRSFSVKVLIAAISVNLLFFGLCLSNTPEAVQRYTAVFTGLTWLQNEETMSEFGYRHDDPDIGRFYSRFSLQELNDIDQKRGASYGRTIALRAHQDIPLKPLIERYTPIANPFLHEFLVHLSRREDKVEKMSRSLNALEKRQRASSAYRENLILQKYYSNTLEHSGFTWDSARAAELEEAYLDQQKPYVSGAGGMMITGFTLKQAWTGILLLLGFVWIGGRRWAKKIRHSETEHQLSK